KRILIHHPYLVDDVALDSQSSKVKLLEKMKRLYFSFQVLLFPNNTYFAQTQHFLSALENKYQGIKVSLLPNPLTNKISFPDPKRFESILTERVENYKKLRVIYVSRYYPHKNHQFIVDLAKAIENKGLNVELLITVDESRIPESLKENIHNLNTLTNIGEIEQEMLESYYLNAHFCIFPSITETFGNGLIEATKFGLPTLALDYPYVDDVLGNSVLKVDSVDSCMNVLESFIGDSFYYNKKSKAVFDYSKKFISVDEWVETLSK
ncbi:glycosyltransferase family 4 protein, partial [Vibrio splendidus]